MRSPASASSPFTRLRGRRTGGLSIRVTKRECKLCATTIPGRVPYIADADQPGFVTATWRNSKFRLSEYEWRCYRNQPRPPPEEKPPPEIKDSTNDYGFFEKTCV